MKIRRPLLRYHGGKWRLAPWIIGNFPSHRVYVEPYGGAASVLIRKPRSYAEIYNDMDGEVVGLFRVLRNPAQARELVRLLKLTPFARDEFVQSYIIADDPIEQARRLITRSYMGFGSTLTGKWATGFRSDSNRSGTTPAHDWANFPQALEAIIGRLRGVVVENRPAIETIQAHDGPNTLHYIDPPYPFETRGERWAGNAYRYEMTDQEHRDMATVLHQVKGMVVLSGYGCPLYDDDLYPRWIRIARRAHVDGARERTEILWISPAADASRFPMFAGLPST